MVKTSYEIHPDDEMLLYLRALGRDDGALFGEYMRTGFRASVQIRETLSRLDRRLAETGAMLDFASGYGRILRFLLREVAPERVTAADIDANAARFLREQFSVRGIVSREDPDEVRLGGPFDLITCISLFTHLPDTLFRRWLARLGQALGPRGLLLLTTQPPTFGTRCFSLSMHLPNALLRHLLPRLSTVLDPQGFLLPAKQATDLRRLGRNRGYTYFPGSESRTLDSKIYGSTFVSRIYVEQVIEEELAGRKILSFLPRSLNGHQDIYVVGAANETEVPAFDLTLPSVCLDELFCEGNLVRFRGWGLSEVDRRPAACVRGFVNDELVSETQTGIERPDLAEIFGEEVQQSGFDGAFPWQDEMSGGVFAVEVEDDRGFSSRDFRRMPL